MYKQSDRRSAIKEIQKFLYVISDQEGSTVPRVSVSGIYGKETTEAVKSFQRSEALNESGSVDLITFNALYKRYSDIISDYNTTDYVLGDGELPLQEGDQNEDVRALHLMLNELSKHYPQIRNAGTGAYFSHRTANALSVLRDIFMMAGEPILDKALYRRIQTELNSRSLAIKKYD